MIYLILSLYLLQAFVAVYLMFVVHDIEKRIKDVEDHLFDV